MYDFNRKFHSKFRQYETININDKKHETKTRKFIELYKKYQAQGALDDEKIFEVALEQLTMNDQHKGGELEDEVDDPVSFGLAESFEQAMNEKESSEPENESSPKNKAKSSTIDIKSLF